ncbi:unnamed protein product [Caenorhabditis auriculariae]|uniref:Uncharacterized protein n=1 Tax=Caenorhabditis auriculariae TaxID=2777116 RepID=A0A8S1HZ89_9PELO|nr:unnamed protein product [Caenorhabditis auriculariae]
MSIRKDRRQMHNSQRKVKPKDASHVHCPSIGNLQKHFDKECCAFLKSLKGSLKFYKELVGKSIEPLDKKLRALHKKLKLIDMETRSLRHWKQFHLDIITHGPEIIEMFNLDDFRPVEENLSPSTKNYVHDNLKTWRSFHDNKKMVEIKMLEKDYSEDFEKDALVKEIILFVEERELFSLEDVCSRSPEELKEILEGALASLDAQRSSMLMKIPQMARRISTEKWHARHFGSSEESIHSTTSEENFSETSSLAGQEDRSKSDELSISDEDDVSSSDDESLDLNSFFDNN